MTGAPLPTPPHPGAEPMAFTHDDFLRGAAWALGAFLMLLLIGETVLFVVLAVVRHASAPPGVAISSDFEFLPLMLGGTIAIGGPVAGVCLLCGAPLAYQLARALRRVQRAVFHVLAFALFGAVFGGLCAGLLYAGVFALEGVDLDMAVIMPVAYTGAAFTSAACAIGWAMAARRARRDDTALPAD